MLYGIDISKWQMGINLANIKADFTIVKATEGTGYVDPYCDKFFQETLRLNRLAGFYHFARPYNKPEAEAEFFFKNTMGYFGKGIPVLDWEKERIHDTCWAKKWLDRIYQLSGVRPLIYMSRSVANDYDWTEVANDYGLWIARYRDNKKDYNYDMSNAGDKPTSKFWKVIALWQWTSCGRLDGYSGDLDCDVFYGDRETWLRYASPDIASIKATEIMTEQVSKEEQAEIKRQEEQKAPKKRQIYTVRKGDTLSSIARKFNISVSEIAAKNKITNRNLIRVGQKLEIC